MSVMGKKPANQLSRATSVLLGTAVLAGCAGSVVGLDQQFEDVIFGGLTYRVTQVAIAESFPIQIGVTVEVENATSTERSVVFPDGCVVLMRAYAGGPTSVWDLATDRACTLALVEVNLAPGEVRQYQTGLVSAAEILDDNLPPGEYRLTAYLRPDGQVVELEMGQIMLDQ